jgi:hypothetical protein
MKKGRSILGKVKVHKQCPTFSSSSSLRKAAKAAARLASCFRHAAIEIAGHHGIYEAPPEAVLFLEAVFP